jgi:hypothetical protein
MKLSNFAMNTLTWVLPRMKLSSILRVSYVCQIPMDTLMQLKETGVRMASRRTAASDEIGKKPEDINSMIVPWIENDFRTDVLDPTIMLAREAIYNILGTKLDSNQQQIKDKAIYDLEKAGNSKNEKNAEKIGQSIMKALGFTGDAVKQGGYYASLLTTRNGSIDGDIQSSVYGAANKFKGLPAFMGGGNQLDSAVGEVLTYLAVGRAGDITKKSRGKGEPKTETEEITEALASMSGLDNYFENQISNGNIPGAAGVLAGIKDLSKKMFDTIFRKKSTQQEKSNKQVDPQAGQAEFKTEDELQHSLESDDVYAPTETTSELDKTSGKGVTDDLDNIPAAQRAQKMEDYIKTQNFADMVQNVTGLDNKNSERVVWMVRHSVNNPRETKDGGVYGADSRTYLTQDFPVLLENDILPITKSQLEDQLGMDAELKKDYDAASKEEKWKALPKKIKDIAMAEHKRLVGDNKMAPIAKAMAEKFQSPVAVKTSGATLSIQLLKTAAAKESMNLVGRICAIEPKRKKFGKVMVFEKGQPEFAHKFNWKIQGGKVLIANAVDVDEEHVNAAYSAAFEAVKEEVMMVNSEEIL